MQVIIIILNTIMTWHVIQTPRDVRLSFFIFAIAGLVSVPHAVVSSPGYYILAFLSLSFKDMDRWMDGMDGMATTFFFDALCWIVCMLLRESRVSVCLLLFGYYTAILCDLCKSVYSFCVCMGRHRAVLFLCVGTAANLVLNVVSQTDVSIAWTQINTFMICDLSD